MILKSIKDEFDCVLFEGNEEGKDQKYPIPTLSLHSADDESKARIKLRCDRETMIILKVLIECQSIQYMPSKKSTRFVNPNKLPWDS